METALSVCVETLITPKLITWSRLVEALSTNPAKIAGAPAGTLSPGAAADLTLIDPSARWTVNPKQFVSKGRHSPFAGRTLTGAIVRVLRGGVEVSAG